jgi:hypothetical protein
MTGSEEDHGRSSRPDAEDRRWSDTGRVLGGQTIGRLGGRVMLCMVCTMHMDIKSAGFLVEPQN